MATGNELDLLWHAEKTLGVFTRRTARSMGVPDHVIDHRLRTGRWEHVQPSTFRVMGAPLTHESDVLAAVLSAQEQQRSGRARRAAASFATCARLLDLRGHAGDADLDPVEITVSGTALPLLWWDTVVHRTSSLDHRDITHVGPVPCTTGARFAIDAAPRAELVEVYRTVDDVIGARLSTQRWLHRRSTVLAPGRRNVGCSPLTSYGRISLRSGPVPADQRLFGGGRGGGPIDCARRSLGCRQAPDADPGVSTGPRTRAWRMRAVRGLGRADDVG